MRFTTVHTLGRRRLDLLRFCFPDVAQENSHFSDDMVQVDFADALSRLLDSSGVRLDGIDQFLLRVRGQDGKDLLTVKI